jgi:hypothetical protein
MAAMLEFVTACFEVVLKILLCAIFYHFLFAADIKSNFFGAPDA